MHIALVLISVIIGVGLILYLHHRLTSVKTATDELPVSDSPSGIDDDSECCGMHITCEKDSLSPFFSDNIEYFDDEELDVFVNRRPDDYSEEEIECFRDVLLTLRPEEIAPWARSIQKRGIALPDDVLDELFMIVNEAREKV